MSQYALDPDYGQSISKTINMFTFSRLFSENDSFKVNNIHVYNKIDTARHSSLPPTHGSRLYPLGFQTTKPSLEPLCPSVSKSDFRWSVSK